MKEAPSPVPLHPDLAECISSTVFGKAILHPLVHEVFYIETHNEVYNRLYEQKLARLKEYEEAGEWGLYIFTYERPYRMERLISLLSAETIGEETFWKHASRVWEDSENVWQWRTQWETLVRLLTSRPEGFMSEADKADLDKLPETITLYRGATYKGKYGLSWTTDYEKAVWFSKRFGNAGAVYTTRVAKTGIFGLIGTRGEKEVILWPQEVDRLKATKEVKRLP